MWGINSSRSPLNFLFVKFLFLKGFWSMARGGVGEDDQGQALRGLFVCVNTEIPGVGILS